MKLWRVNFPFYFIVRVIFLCSISSVFCQEQAKINLSQRALDSITQYYILSKSDSLSLSQRLQYVSSFLDGVTGYQQDSLFYNGLLQKTWLLGKTKQLDSAIIYSHQLYNRTI